MLSQLDDLLAIAEVVSLDAEFFEYRQVDIAGRLTFANDMATVIRELSACDEHGNFIPVMRPHFLTHTVVACDDGDRLESYFVRLLRASSDFGTLCVVM